MKNLIDESENLQELAESIVEAEKFVTSRLEELGSKFGVLISENQKSFDKLIESITLSKKSTDSLIIQKYTVEITELQKVLQELSDAKFAIDRQSRSVVEGLQAGTTSNDVQTSLKSQKDILNSKLDVMNRRVRIHLPKITRHDQVNCFKR